MRELKIGQIYRHFKGKYYVVLDVVNDADSGHDDIKQRVIYQALYGERQKWARRFDEFMSEVDHEKYPEIKQKYRFEEVNMEDIKC